MGFDSKHEFAPPTILLGLLLCPWMWGISSQLLQCLLSYWGFSDLGCGYLHIASLVKCTLDMGYLFTAAPVPCSPCTNAAKSLQSCLTLRPHRRQPTRLLCPWDSPGKNTGVGCYFLLQCMKVKSESEVTQSCPTLCDPIDFSLPGSSAHGIFQARVLEWGAIAFSECSD